MLKLILVLIFLGVPAAGQSISVDLGTDGSITSTTLQLFALITVLSLAPGIAIMVTCFPFILTVFSILRQAIGLQQAPPNMLIVSLALFLTYYVMEPVFWSAYQDGVEPFLAGAIELDAAWRQVSEPFQTFMMSRVDQEVLIRMQNLRAASASVDPNLGVLIPSFMLSEIARAFEIGFLIFLPFLIIDLVVAAVLMSMGMMMVPPAVVSLPFKLAFFVVSDGWVLLAEALVRGYTGA